MTRGKFLGYMGRFQSLTEPSPERFLKWAWTVQPVEVQDLIDKTASGFKPAIQVCYRSALRSFLRHNGYSTLPKADLRYVSPVWHRGYRRHEIRKLLGYLRGDAHKLFCYIAFESGLRAHTILQLRYRHIMDDMERSIVPVAVRLEPRFYTGHKAAGYTFLGEGSIRLVRDCFNSRLTHPEPDALLVPRNYQTIYWALYRARRRAGLDRSIQPCHGFRKYFENALDQAGVDHERKMMIEGHLSGTRARYYTDRDMDQLRETYRKAYPCIDLDGYDPEAIESRLHSWDIEQQTLQRKMNELSGRVYQLTEIISKLSTLKSEALG